jgi:hypothetical protein
MYWLRTRGHQQPRPAWHWPLRIGLFFGLGLASAWLIFYAASRGSLWSMWQVAEETQMQVAKVRPYWPFLAWNFNDFSMFTGWPLALLAVVGAWIAFGNLRQKNPKQGDVMIAASTLTLVLVGLSGTPRGESGRLLMFMVPLQLFAAAYAIRGQRFAGGLLTAVQVLALLVVVICLQVLAPEFKARAAPMAPAVPLPALPPVPSVSGAVFGDSIRLSSYAGRIDTRVDAQGNHQSVLYLWLTWEDLKPMDVRYAYALQPIMPDGTPSPARTSISPIQDEYPMTCWKPGERDLTDRVKLVLEAPVTGRWWVDLGIYDPTTGEAAKVVTQDGDVLQQLRLGPFEN